MMIVLLIISILILIAIPNVTKHSSSIDEKGCQAYKKMVEAQVQAFKMDEKKLPTTIEELITAKYLPESATCPDGSILTLDNEGNVLVNGTN